MAEDATVPAVSDLPDMAPETGKSLSFDEATNSIADLLDDDPAPPDPKAKPVGDDEETAPTEPDPLGLDDDANDAEPDTPDDENQDPQDVKPGHFAPDTAKVNLNGKVMSIADLKEHAVTREKELQRGVSQKFEAISAKDKELTQRSQQVADERQYLIWHAETYAPQPPKPPELPADQDPIGHLKYNEELRNYQAFVNSYHAMKRQAQEEAQAKDRETKAQRQERAKAEGLRLLEHVKIDPKDATKVGAFFQAIENGAQEFYGITPKELEQIAASTTDHRLMVILRDAIRSKQNKKAAPEVAEKLRTVPKIVRAPTARANPSQQSSRQRQAAGERASKTGRPEDLTAFLSLIPDL